MTTIGLRPATHTDRTLCYLLHQAGMRGYVEAVWGRDEQTRRAFHEGRRATPRPGTGGGHT